MIETLQALHDSEINFTIEAFFDGCFIVKLGDGLNGYIWEQTFPTMKEAVAGLFSAAGELHPDSAFVRSQR